MGSPAHARPIEIINLSYTVQIFNEIDADGNGYITPDEMKVGFEKLGVELSLV